MLSADRSIDGSALMMSAALSLALGCAQTTPPSESQLCVVRHAQALKNLEPPPEGATEQQLDHLTAEGRSQAQAVGASLPAGPKRVWTSPAERAIQTARLLDAAEIGIETRVRPLEGDEPWERRMESWARGEDPRPSGGESLADGASRTLAALEEVRKDVPPGTHAIVVTHGDIASILLGELRGTPLLERPRRDALATGTFTCLPLVPRARP